MPRRDRNEKILRPVHPNAGIELAYRKRLDELIAEMQTSTIYWLRASYRATPPIAQDATPADALRRSIRSLSARWLRRFDDAAPKLADWFARATASRSSDALRKILKDGGFTVNFTLTPEMANIMATSIAENVSLIRSIPQQYFTQVEGIVYRSVTAGRDLGYLTKELQTRFGITRRRAAFISLDQNNKMTAAFTRTRQLELGLNEAEWHHSGGGRHPRPTHVAAGKAKVRYNIRTGWLDPASGKFIHPGDEPGCRCVSRPIVKGFS